MPVILARASQQAAGYRPEGGVERCAYCRFYGSANNCGRIQGPVSPRGWCRYFSRMVWLRMDGGDTDMAVASGPPPPTMDLQFTTLSSLPASVTLTRASTATYYNGAGTLTTAATNAARFDYNPSTLAANGLLLEEARTNLLLRSNFASWTVSGSTLTAAAGIGPDGTATAARIAETATTAPHLIQQLLTISASTTYVLSVFAKAAEDRYLQVSLDDGSSNGSWATFDLQGGTITGPITSRGTGVAGTASMQPVGGGFYRCSVASTIGPNTSGRAMFLCMIAPNPAFGASYAGNASNGLLLWGAQLEQGTYPTSYIATVSAAVTRSADVATISSLTGRNATAESYAAEFTLAGINASANPRIVGGSATQLGPLFVTTTRAGAATDLVGTATTANTLTLGAVSKLAANWASPNAGRVCLNAGAVVGATTLTTGFAAMTAPKLMGDSAAADTATGWMRRFRYWPRILSDAELQSNTT